MRVYSWAVDVGALFSTPDPVCPTHADSIWLVGEEGRGGGGSIVALVDGEIHAMQTKMLSCTLSTPSWQGCPFPVFPQQPPLGFDLFGCWPWQGKTTAQLSSTAGSITLLIYFVASASKHKREQTKAGCQAPVATQAALGRRCAGSHRLPQAVAARRRSIDSPSPPPTGTQPCRTPPPHPTFFIYPLTSAVRLAAPSSGGAPGRCY